MRRFDRDEQLNPIGFEDRVALRGWPRSKSTARAIWP